MAKKGVVNIRGKEYKTVVLRVNEFREMFKPEDGWAIRTWLIQNEGDRVVIQASICDKDDHVVATGFAEEDRTQGNINRTSAMENAETSAVGRALSAFGLGGEEYCSADELVVALSKQDKLPDVQPEKLDLSPEQVAALVVNLGGNPAEKKEKPDPEKRIEKYLGTIEAIIGEDEAMKNWVNLLRRNPEQSKGSLSMRDLKSNRDVTFSNMWKISDLVKEMYEATTVTGEEG